MASVKMPTAAELAKVGSELGMNLSDSDIAFFQETFAGNVAAYNMLEGMVMFLAAVLAAQLAGKASQAALGATVFFWARLVYWPVYIAGIIYLRTAVWFVSIIGLGMIVYQAL